MSAIRSAVGDAAAGQILTYIKERCNIMQTIEVKLERIHVLADLLLTILVGNPEAQVLTEIILETAVMPEA